MGQIGKWAVILIEFIIIYVPQKAIKGQHLADFLTAHPIHDNSPLITELLDKEVFIIEDTEPHWEMYFDGAYRLNTLFDVSMIKRRVRAGVVSHSSKWHFVPLYSLLKESYSNNEAEYEAFIIGLTLALDMRITCLCAFGDSQLVVQQLNEVYEVCKLELVTYYQKAKQLCEQFVFIQVDHIRRPENA